MKAHPKIIHGIIHTASASAGLVGAGLSQIPGSDAPVIVSLQTTMIIFDRPGICCRVAGCRSGGPAADLCRRPRRQSFVPMARWLDSGLRKHNQRQYSDLSHGSHRMGHG